MLASRRCSIASTTSLASRCLIIGQTKGPSSCVGKHPTVFTRSQTTHWALVVDLWPLTTMWKIGKQPTPTHPPPRVPTVLVTKTRRDGLSDRAVHLRGGGGAEDWRRMSSSVSWQVADPTWIGLTPRCEIHCSSVTKTFAQAVITSAV